MYSLLVVDDEAIITDGLYELFTYDGDLELMVTKAYSATEALRAAQSVRIDILVSDIAMPRMNGLELQREIAALWPECKTIFLTGYDHFEYIQSAMRSDAMDYILKSESDEVVLDAVKKTIASIEREKRERYAAEKAEHDRKLTFPLLQMMFLRSLLEGTECSDAERRSKFKELELPLDAGRPALMLLGYVDSWPEDYPCTAQARVLNGIRRIAEEHLAAHAALVPVEIAGLRLIWLLQPKFNSEMLPVFLQGTMGAMQSACREVLDVPVSFATHREPVDWPDLPSRFDALARSAANSSALGGELLLIDERQYRGEAQGADADRDAEAECGGSAGRVFAFIKDYTDHHIGEDLTLMTFAELLHFHPFYLSRLFKQATGQSLSDYILDAKIKKARDMMRQESMRINEIASSLGFTSSSYFAKVFKKHTSLNPQEYRDSLK